MGESIHQEKASSRGEYLMTQFVHWIRNPLSSTSLHPELLEEEITERKIESEKISSLLGSIQLNIEYPGQSLGLKKVGRRNNPGDWPEE
jgi:hypothetical protein